MNIIKDKVVSLAYNLKASGLDKDVENITVDKPFTFIFGSGYLMKEFESKIEGLKTNDTFEFTLTSDEAYGSQNDNAIVDLPQKMFEINGKLDEDLLKIGKIIPMQDNSGKRMEGKVIAVFDDKVKLDFNPPMAGKDLSFKGHVIDIRDATEDELKHGHLHDTNCNSCSGCEDPAIGCD